VWFENFADVQEAESPCCGTPQQEYRSGGIHT
jgi:hypothetical protein